MIYPYDHSYLILDSDLVNMIEPYNDELGRIQCTISLFVVFSSYNLMDTGIFTKPSK